MANSAVQKLRDQELSDLEAVMSTEAGRRLMHRLVEQSGVYQTSYSPEMPGDQSLHMAFREGSRNVGLFLIGEMQEAAPGSFMKMIEEHSDVE